MLYEISRLMKKKYNVRLSFMTIVFIIVAVTFVLYLETFRSCVNSVQTVREKPKYRLMVIILTHPDAMRTRDTIRKTWLSEKHSNVKYFFSIGTSALQSEQIETLESEKHKHSDLLLLSRLEDSYGTLTRKIQLSFEHVYENYDFDFLVKADDDSLVLVHKILKELDQWEIKGTKKELYWGFFNGKAQVKRSGPWREHDWNLCDYYLPYAVGGGYVLSYNLVKFIATNLDVLRQYNSEDVSVGLWLAPLANIERKHDVRFDTEYRSRGCSNNYIITHKQSTESMKNMYDHYKSTGVLCAKETRNRMSYHYNWIVPPSQCCNRQLGIP